MRNMITMSLLLMATAAAAQDFKTLNQEMMKTDLNSTDLACTLTDAKLVERKSALQKAIFSKINQLEELNDGYWFHFKDTDDLLADLFHYILAEKQCCPFFQQEVVIKPNKAGISWKVSGREGVKEILTFMLEEEGLNRK